MTKKVIPQGWELGGLLSEDGLLDRPLPFDGNYIPTAVKADSKYLYYGLGRGGIAKVQLGPDLLKDFLRLGSASGEEIAGFARRYGILFLCKKHSLPMWHGSKRKLCSPAGATVKDKLLTGGVMKEPLKSWRQYAVQATGIMNIAAALRNGDLGSANDWKDADPDYSERRSRYQATDSKQQILHLDRLHLENLIASWLGGNVAPIFTWVHSEYSESENTTFYFTERPPSISFGGCLLGMLGLKLAVAISGSGGFYKCAGDCQEWFFAKRRRKPGVATYCESCGRRAANRDAQRRRRRLSQLEIDSRIDSRADGHRRE